MTAAAEKFMQKTDARADALPWLAHAPADAAPAWVKALRETAADVFAHVGLPAANAEGWQYTSLRGLKAEKYAFTTAPAVFDAKALPAPLLADSYRAVLVNGQFQPNLSNLPKNVQVLSLLEAADKMPDISEYLVHAGELADHPFLTLNAAHMQGGLVIRSGKSVEIDKPFEVLLYTQDGALSCPRVMYWLGENAGATIIEHMAGAGEYLSLPHAEIVQESASRLNLYRVCDESQAGNQIGSTHVTLMKRAHFEGFSGSFGGALTRQSVRMRLLEDAIYSSVCGIYLKEGRQSQDFTILADHFEVGGKSVQNFKGVIDDQARAIFQGKIHVCRTAQKTDGYQSHHALLLSAEAEASAKPELEIYADDVKCSHGATSGQLDEGALFYLRSRGIPEKQARSLLVESFLNEVVEKVANADMRAVYQGYVARWLAKRGGA